MQDQSPASYLTEWARLNGARIASTSDAQRALDAIEALPWLELHPDWARMPSRRVNLDNDPVDLSGTLFEDAPAVLVYMSPKLPAIIAETQHAIASIDEICWRSPGQAFLLALRSDAATAIQIDERSIAEYDGAATLTVPLIGPA